MRFKSLDDRTGVQDATVSDRGRLDRAFKCEPHRTTCFQSARLAGRRRARYDALLTRCARTGAALTGITMATWNKKRLLVLVGDDYEDLELWYPILRVQEAGAAATIAGQEKKHTYRGKHGYP